MVDSHIFISIHASAKEATLAGIAFDVGFLISIHASAKEATVDKQSELGSTIYFNPRLREGGDRIHHPAILPYRNFNPRLREGGDNIGDVEHVWYTIISIHASAKEATVIKIVIPHFIAISIHASAKEATVNHQT